jgi:hypothetical protein
MVRAVGIISDVESGVHYLIALFQAHISVSIKHL